MRISFFFLSLVVALAGASSHATTPAILETATMADVVPLIDDQTWVLFDLDNTVFEAKQALGHVNWLHYQVRKRMLDF